MSNVTHTVILNDAAPAYKHQYTIDNYDGSVRAEHRKETPNTTFPIIFLFCGLMFPIFVLYQNVWSVKIVSSATTTSSLSSSFCVGPLWWFHFYIVRMYRNLLAFAFMHVETVFITLVPVVCFLLILFPAWIIRYNNCKGAHWMAYSPKCICLSIHNRFAFCTNYGFVSCPFDNVPFILMCTSDRVCIFAFWFFSFFVTGRRRCRRQASYLLNSWRRGAGSRQ